MRLASPLRFDRIGTQIAALVVLALAAAQAFMMVGFFLLEKEAPLPGERFASIERLRFLARLVDMETDAKSRAALIKAGMVADPDLMQFLEAPVPDASSAARRLPHGLLAHSGDGPALYISNQPGALSTGGEAVVVARLADGMALAAPLPASPAYLRLLPPGAIAGVAVLASMITVLSFWAARQIAAPLARFAKNAEQFTSDVSGPPIKESGPLEIRRAAIALNDMQRRVVKLIADRTRMLAAIGHDLRTPITRLRLRAEEIGNASLRAKVLDDLSTMENLVGSALAFLKGQSDEPQKVKTDLSALVQTVCDGFVECQGRLRVSATSHIHVLCDPDHLMRAIGNLVENGLRFGTDVDVAIFSEGAVAIVEIYDDGPGIPESEKAQVIEPFYRGDAARSLNNGEGFGLGLSIAKSLVEKNAGSLKLLDRLPCGLIARIEISSVR